MQLLKKAVNEQAFLKAGTLGFQGSGKSYTASMLAIAISKLVAGNRPVAFFDTEAGSDFLVKKFERSGIELVRIKSRAFSDLLAVGKEAQSECSVLIVDSITHVWNEVCDAYLKRLNNVRKGKNLAPLKKMEFQHWAEVKRAWQEWTEFYLNSALHIVICGRAGYEYEFVENDDTHKKELQKAGTKMKVEGEFGFEPSLLVEMERVSRGAEPGAGWIHRAHVLKDRTDTVNGKAFDFGFAPKSANTEEEWREVYNVFAPVINSLNLGGTHAGVDTSRTSQGMFSEEGETDQTRRSKRVQIALEEIQGALVALWPGQDAKSKACKQLVIEALFQTRSWTKVETMSLERLEAELVVLRAFEFAAKGDQSFMDAEDGIANLVVKCRRELTDAAVEAAADAAFAGRVEDAEHEDQPREAEALQS